MLVIGFHFRKEKKKGVLEVFVRGVYFVLTLMKKIQEEDLLSEAYCLPYFTGFTVLFSAW